MRARFAIAFAACHAIACLQVDPAPPVPGTVQIRLQAAAWDGAPASQQELPLRPRLALRHLRPLAPDADAVILLRGTDDADLRTALAHKPLRADVLARAVASDVGRDGDALVITPRAALERGTPYTLAVASFERHLDGTSLGGSVPATFDLVTATGPDAGARVLESFPADGAVSVGTNLEAAVIALDGEIANGVDAVWLQDPAGFAFPAEATAAACAELAPEHQASACVKLTPASSLAPEASYNLIVGSDALDAHGAPIGPFVATFHTAPGRDAWPPRTLGLSCSADEQVLDVGCALADDQSISLRVRADESVTATLVASGTRAATAAPSGDVELRLDSLPPDRRFDAILTLRDSAGNESEHALSLRTLPSLPTVSVVEVRADPLGPEPAQELVELLNYGGQSVSIEGFALDPCSGSSTAPIERAFVMAAGTRLLLVADDFDASDDRDARPPPGAPLVRVGRALAGTGLTNTGSELCLHDAEGHRLSAAPATPRPRPGVCNVRVSADMRDGRPGSFAYDPHDGCTPGR
jgi:hypothetical protein